MKKTLIRALSFFLTLSLLTGLLSPLAGAIEYEGVESITVDATAALLIDLDSDQVLYDQDADQQRYPASITKIMTALLTLEAVGRGELDLSTEVTVDAAALTDITDDSSTANLKAGEVISVKDLLYCLLVSSANEAANILAMTVCGDIPTFVDRMNQRAQELGMTGTHFANAHGLHDENHYTTARDLTILSCWAWKNPDFREYATTTAHTVPATNLSDSRALHTTNYLTSAQITAKYYYSKASGIKTGFTTPAGGCLAATATDGNLTYLSVVCGCETLIDSNGEDLDMRFVETKRLMEFGFENFDYVQVLSDTQMLGQPAVTNAKGRANVVVHANANATVLLPKSCRAEDITMNLVYDSTQTLDAPLEEGQRVGTVTAMYQGIPLASAELVTLTAVERDGGLLDLPSETPTQQETAEKESSGLMKYWYLIVPLAILFILICILLLVRAANIRKAKRRAERRRRREAQRRNGNV